MIYNQLAQSVQKNSRSPRQLRGNKHDCNIHCCIQNRDDGPDRVCAKALHVPLAHCLPTTIRRTRLLQKHTHSLGLGVLNRTCWCAHLGFLFYKARCCL
jgi:hypothetical protein